MTENAASLSTTTDTPLPGSPEWSCALSDLDRLRDIAGFDITNPDLRRALEEVSERTCAVLGQPTSMTTLVLDTAQFVAGSAGLDGWMAQAQGTPVEWAFCANTVTTREPYVVEDAREHPVQKTNPLVTQNGQGSYLGVPIVSNDGNVLGAHCVMSGQAERYSEQDLAVLRAAAEEIVGILERFRRQG